MSNGLTKQEQWKRAAIVISWIVGSWPELDEADIRWQAIRCLENTHEALPWEYPWREVVASVRQRSGHFNNR